MMLSMKGIFNFIIMDKKLIQRIRKFYEKEITNHPDESIIRFKSKCKIGFASYTPEDMLDNEEQYKKLSPSRLSIAISKNEQVPQSLLNACDRISWYLKHSMGKMLVIRVTFEETITFAICIEGYVDDGWDNSGSFIEVYTKDGELVGALRIPIPDEPDNWRWVNRPIQHFDFDSSAPNWWENEQRRWGEAL